MSENYSLNSNFGLNVSSNNSSVIKRVAEDIDESVGNLFDEITNYVSKYENVFSGEVAEEINMFTRQAMFIGMSMRAEDKKGSNFDMNI